MGNSLWDDQHVASRERFYDRVSRRQFIGNSISEIYQGYERPPFEERPYVRLMQVKVHSADHIHV